MPGAPGQPSLQDPEPLCGLFSQNSRNYAGLVKFSVRSSHDYCYCEPGAVLAATFGLCFDFSGHSRFGALCLTMRPFSHPPLRGGAVAAVPVASPRPRLGAAIALSPALKGGSRSLALLAGTRWRRPGWARGGSRCGRRSCGVSCGRRSGRTRTRSGSNRLSPNILGRPGGEGPKPRFLLRGRKGGSAEGGGRFTQSPASFLNGVVTYNSLGHLSCTLCSAPVKSELLWQTHVLGKQHREVSGRQRPPSPVGERRGGGMGCPGGCGRHIPGGAEGRVGSGPGQTELLGGSPAHGGGWSWAGCEVLCCSGPASHRVTGHHKHCVVK